MEVNARYFDLIRKVTLKLEKWILSCLKSKLDSLPAELTECINDMDFEGLTNHLRNSNVKSSIQHLLASFSVANEFVDDFFTVSIEIHSKLGSTSFIPHLMFQSWYSKLMPWIECVPAELATELSKLECIADYNPTPVLPPKTNDLDLSAAAESALQQLVEVEASSNMFSRLQDEINDELLGLVDEEEEYAFEQQQAANSIGREHGNNSESSQFSNLNLLSYNRNFESFGLSQCSQTSFPVISCHTPFICHLMFLLQRHMSDVLILESSSSSSSSSGSSTTTNSRLLRSHNDTTLIFDTSYTAALESAIPILAPCTQDIADLMQDYCNVMDEVSMMRELGNCLLLCGTHGVASFVNQYVKMFGCCGHNNDNDDVNQNDDDAIEENMMLEGAVRKRLCIFLSRLSTSIGKSLFPGSSTNIQQLALNLYEFSLIQHFNMLPMFLDNIPVPKWDLMNWIICTSTLLLLNASQVKRSDYLTSLFQFVLLHGGEELSVNDRLEVIWSVFDNSFGMERKCPLQPAFRQGLLGSLSNMGEVHQFKIFNLLRNYFD